MTPLACTEVEETITYFGTKAYFRESDEDILKACTSFDSFHHQAKYPFIQHGFIVGFLILSLKHCVGPSALKEALSINTIYLVVLFALGHPLGFLSAMTCDIQRGLRALIT